MIDTATIRVKAGKGGDGLASFRREKFVEKGGPWGGDGGRGGDIVFIADEHLNTLRDFHRQREYKAKNGMPGMKNDKKGKDGEDLIIKIPLGTSVLNEKKELLHDMIHAKEEFILEKGGQGGLGNVHFKSSTNQTPYQYTEGEQRLFRTIKLELKLLADAGIIGLPNSGKTTLLNALTRASAKVGSYEFTTIEPNLGVLHVGQFVSGINEDIVLADIPGLIEGAAEGKGLGHDFLRHIERTVFVLHVIDGTIGIEDPSKIVKSYEIIRDELEKWSHELSLKKEIILINKTDIAEVSEAFEKMKESLKRKFPQAEIFAVSAFSRTGLEEITKTIAKIYMQERNDKKEAISTKPKKVFTIDNLPNRRIIEPSRLNYKY